MLKLGRPKLSQLKAVQTEMEYICPCIHCRTKANPLVSGCSHTLCAGEEGTREGGQGFAELSESSSA